MLAFTIFLAASFSFLIDSLLFLHNQDLLFDPILCSYLWMDFEGA